MDELNNYNDSIIRLYNQGFSIKCIADFLYTKVNKRLKTFNKQSNGELWVNIPKISKVNCFGNAYNVIYKYKMKNNGGN